MIPVDGAGAGPEVLVAKAIVVVEVQLANAGFQKLEGVIEAGVAQVRVASVEVSLGTVPAFPESRVRFSPVEGSNRCILEEST